MCRIETTVGKVRVGSKLMLGQYGVTSEEVFPIMWLKATPNGDFISAEVLDYICFDARERHSEEYGVRMYGNSTYEYSNIVLFLNSDDEDWWHPTYGSDAPPDGNNVQIFSDAYHGHCGFLHHFEDYEVDSIAQKTYTVAGVEVTSPMRLPSYAEFVGGSRFPLFSRRGIRAHGTADFISRRGLMKGFDEGSYIEFWLSDLYMGGPSTIMTRNGDRGNKLPYHSAGLRPVCTLKPETLLEMGENGAYRVKPFGVQNKLFTDDELFELLGVARP